MLYNSLKPLKCSFLSFIIYRLNKNHCIDYSIVIQIISLLNAICLMYIIIYLVY